jgi:glycosyltransferase involved in cell wall biosynthesis
VESDCKSTMVDMQKSVFATIIVPTFNQAAYLPAALDSILAQTDDDWEAIIVNDGSTDETAQIADSYSQRDARIRCIHKRNGGVASALNTGLAYAKGEWVHWLSSDDMFEPNKLELNRIWIGRHPRTSFFFSYFTLLNDVTGVRDKRDLWGPIPDAAHQLLTLFYRNYISGISICVNRKAWELVGYFDESLRYGQDYDQWLRLLQQHQGCFIPKWTVISRNHAEQGSETFPDACYFDTAKATIRFINEHSFKELVPWLDFNNREAVHKAVSYALDVASDRTAFLYSLGAHPALVLRVVEWVFSTACADSYLRAYVQRRVAENSLAEGDDDWVWMWRKLAAAIHPDGRACIYQPLEPIQIELREYCQRLLRGERSATPLRDYLVKFEDATPSDLEVLGTGGPRVVFLLGSESSLETYVPVLCRLADRGARIVVLAQASEQSSVFWQQHAWGDLLSIEAYGRDCLPWLGTVELMVALPGNTIPLWLGGLAGIELSSHETGERVEEYVADAYFSPISKKRPVIFLERVLWGGGAERVVMDVVRYLDRRSYQPIILTMFDEHVAPPKLPSYVLTYNRHNFDSAEHRAPEVVLKSPRRWLVAKIRGVYHLVLSDSLRSRLRLRQRCSSLRRSILRHVGRDHPLPGNDSISYRTGCAADAHQKGYSLDYIGAAAHHNKNVETVLKALNEFGSDAVLVAVMEEAAVAAWLAQGGRRFPYIASLHTFESKCMADIYSTKARWRAESNWLSTACDRAQAVTLPSDGCVEDLRRNFSVAGHNIQKLWNPVDCVGVRRLSFQQEADALAWRDQTEGFRLVHVGRLDPQKNHDLLLDVCIELKRRGVQISLALVGEGHDRQRIEKRIVELGLSSEVTLVGERKNPFPWIKAANVLVLTSHFEAFALVLVEAMVCGTPVVSVDCPAGPAEILANGEYGLLVSNYNSAVMADAVERLIVDAELSQQLVVRGYERAEMFDIKKIVQQWQSLIDTVPAAIDDQQIHQSLESCS